MTLTRADIVLALTNQIGLSRRESTDLVEAIFEDISTRLEAGEDVRLSGFGNFSLRIKNARVGRNPKSGEPATISARRVVTFQPSQKLKTAVAVGMSARQAEAKRKRKADEVPGVPVGSDVAISTLA